jgi:hypothetical protein
MTRLWDAQASSVGLIRIHIRLSNLHSLTVTSIWGVCADSIIDSYFKWDFGRFRLSGVSVTKAVLVHLLRVLSRDYYFCDFFDLCFWLLIALRLVLLRPLLARVSVDIIFDICCVHRGSTRSIHWHRSSLYQNYCPTETRPQIQRLGAWVGSATEGVAPSVVGHNSMQAYAISKSVSLNCNGFVQRVAKQQLRKQGPTRNNRWGCLFLSPAPL